MIGTSIQFFSPYDIADLGSGMFLMGLFNLKLAAASFGIGLIGWKYRNFINYIVS